jgi:hypothetical protein
MPGRTSWSWTKGSIEDRTFSLEGSPDSNVTIQQFAGAAYLADDLPEGMQPLLSADYDLRGRSTRSRGTALDRSRRRTGGYVYRP